MVASRSIAALPAGGTADCAATVVDAAGASLVEVVLDEVVLDEPSVMEHPARKAATTTIANREVGRRVAARPIPSSVP
jgi:hypothetical protein